MPTILTSNGEYMIKVTHRNNNSVLGPNKTGSSMPDNEHILRVTKEMVKQKVAKLV